MTCFERLLYRLTQQSKEIWEMEEKIIWMLNSYSEYETKMASKNKV